MFELLNKDLEDCIEILRELRDCEDSIEHYRMLAEHRLNLDEIQKTIDLCELLCYYYRQVKDRKDC